MALTGSCGPLGHNLRPLKELARSLACFATPGAKRRRWPPKNGSGATGRELRTGLRDRQSAPTDRQSRLGSGTSRQIRTHPEISSEARRGRRRVRRRRGWVPGNWPIPIPGPLKRRTFGVLSAYFRRTGLPNWQRGASLLLLTPAPGRRGAPGRVACLGASASNRVHDYARHGDAPGPPPFYE